MLINLTDCFKSHGKVEDRMVSYEPDEFNGFPIKAKPDFNIRFTNIGDGKVRVTGQWGLTLLMPCDRCLTEVETLVEIDVDTTFVEPDGFHDIDSDEQDEFMEGYELDTTKLINNELIMSLPMKILCKEDCKGLCLKCGHNLNDGDCGCDRFVPDPRMAAIQDIFNAINKEV